MEYVGKFLSKVSLTEPPLDTKVGQYEDYDTRYGSPYQFEYF